MDWLRHLLSVPYALKPDVKSLFNELKQYEYNNADSKNKSEKKLTADILKQLSEEYEIKSNWDRYFSDKLQGETSGRFMKEWSSLSCLEKITYLDGWITKKDVLKV